MLNLFITIFNMNITASYVIAAIVLVRLLIKKAPKAISYALWTVAGFRLIIPFSFESDLSLIPFKSRPIPVDIGMQSLTQFEGGIDISESAVNLIPNTAPIMNANPLQILFLIAGYI
ncbi:BlaR1 peptidase M56 [Oxobacter pfennigii]|uniref:BlaR1 peptidase M56 n=1 Tax=Oxobacter pfennigii TaxID=36849 RepID=A0A0N8NTK6_9CLOT|nr:M56 family metallopeptidase [Oxobacter pfennigii]KPU45096.1 BlaR1 peptidase M56 [Oxobacter pfennigii]